MNWIKNWTSFAACKGTEDTLFVKGKAQHLAKRMCFTCKVRAECLADALDNKIEFGVWGGMTERERRALLRKKPNVKSWQKVLESAKRAA